MVPGRLPVEEDLSFLASFSRNRNISSCHHAFASHRRDFPFSVTAAAAARASIDGSAQDDIERALRARAILVQDLEQPVNLPELVVRLLALEVRTKDPPPPFP